jgi:hypothetical protein
MILFSASTIHFVTIFMLSRLKPAALFFTMDQLQNINVACKQKNPGQARIFCYANHQFYLFA